MAALSAVDERTLLFDSHCHLNDEQFTTDLNAVWQRALAAGVGFVVVPGVDVPSSQRAVEIAARFDGVYAAVGIHPEAAKQVPDADFDTISQLAAHPKVVAIGEIGLDYYWDAAPRPEQQAVLERQILIARRLQLPIVVHNRDATEDTLCLLERVSGGEVGGVMHCFTGDNAAAGRCLELGLYLSFGGPLTFKNATTVRTTAASLPLDRLLVETDAPYLSPAPLRGKRNEPSRVRIVAQKLAEVQGRTLAEVTSATTANAKRLFAKSQPGWQA